MAQRTIFIMAALASIGAHATTSSSAASGADATSTMTVHLPMMEAQTVVMGSIMGVDATATTIFLTCPTDASALDCGLGNGMELIEGTSTLGVHFTESAIGTIDVDCAVASNTASCTTVMTTYDYAISGTAAASSQVVTTSTTVLPDISSYSLPVTVTAGLEKLSAATGSAATGSAATGSASTSGATGSTGSASSSATATAGAPRATLNTALVGAAVLAGGALLL